MCLKDESSRPPASSDSAEPEGGATGDSSSKDTTANSAIAINAGGGGGDATDYGTAPQSVTLLSLHVRNVSSGGVNGQLKVLFVTPNSTISCLVASVARSFKFDPMSFALVRQSKNGEQVELHNLPQDQELATIFGDEPDARNNLILCDLNKQGPPRKAEDDDLTLGASASPTIPYNSNYTPWFYSGDNEAASRATLKKNNSLEKTTDENKPSNIKVYDIPGIVNYVGLVNQAMTCYLNSLLQTLYMTPEFRNAIYRWEFTGSDEEALKSIPFQLQKLFLQLQTTSRTAVETTSLTRSFGWDSNEAWQQHDIQELCRVMFEALEQCFKNTDQANLIDTLYEGKMKDYVKCLECGTESAREDTFLDIPLPIRPFGSNTAFKSVEEALRAFVEPELLTGSNKYECSKCASLCDAHKGLKFTKFPYLLTIHLKRFDFDYQTFHRIKLNDEVTFPNHLDLNTFIEGSTIKDESPKSVVPCPAGTPDKLSSDKVDDSSITDSGSAFDAEESNSSIEVTSTQSQTDIDTQDEDEGIDVSSIYNEKNKLANGPFVYDLFSIMVHSGSASGGHYYAYIRDFKTNEWFCFNDQTVSKITYDDIRKTYGGSNTKGYYWSSSANAYMLMYRLIDKERNAQFFSKEEMPTHITNLSEKMVNEEEAEREAREIERSMIKLKVYYYNPILKVYVINKLKLLKDTTLNEATKQAYEKLSLESEGVPLERCRLVKYEDVHESIECSFDNQDNEPLSEIMASFRSSYKFDLLLEVRDEGKDFEEYKPGGTTVKVYTIDLTSQEVDGPQTIRVNQNLTVKQLKETLGQSLSLDADRMRIVTEKYSGDFRPLANDAATLKTEAFYRSMKIYIEASGKEPVDYFLGSLMYAVLDRYENTITLTCQMPTVTKEILEELQIPLLPKEESDTKPKASEEAAETPVQGSLPAVPVVNSVESTLNTTQPVDASHLGAAALLPSTSTSSTPLLLGSSVTSPPSTSPLSYSQVPPTFTSSPMPSQPIAPPSTLPICSTSCSSAPTLLPPPDLSNQVSTNLVAVTSVKTDAVGQPVAPSTPLLSTFVSNTLQASMVACSRNSSLSAGVVAGGNISDGEDEGIVDMDCVTGSSSSAVNSDQSASEDSSLTSDSDRTLVGDPPEDKLSNTSESPDYHNVSSPEESKEKENIDDAWGLPPHISEEWNYDTQEETKRYFRAHLPITMKDDTSALSVSVDKRITIGQLKKDLQKHVGVSHENFKLFKIYTNSTQEFECTRMNETLMCFVESSIFKVQLSRALLPGEHKCKIYLLDLKATDEPAIFLIDSVIQEESTISKVKEMIVKEVLNSKSAVELPSTDPNLIRLRKKSWKNPLTIYPDHYVFANQIPLFPNIELYLQVLDKPDTINKEEDELAVYIRRWRPSTYTTDALVEVLLRSHTIEELKQQITTVSGIPPEDVMLAKGKGAFPCDMSVLDIATDLEWTQRSGPLDQKAFYIQEDGTVVFYKDKFEKTKKLSENEKSQLMATENTRLHRDSYLTCTRAKRSVEKGLKINLYNDSDSKGS